MTTFPDYNFTVYGSVTFQTPLLLSVWFLLTMLNFTSIVSTCSLLSVKKHTQCTVYQNISKLRCWWKELSFTLIKITYHIVYVAVCSYFVFCVWVHELPWYIQLSQIVPGLSILLEGVVQDVFALFFSACPSALSLALDQWKRKVALRVKFLALLNFSLFVHALILVITAVAVKATISTVLVEILTLLEVLYRMHSTYTFYNIIRNVHEVFQHTLIAGQDHSVQCLKQCSRRKPPCDNESICQLPDAETTYPFLPEHSKKPLLRCKYYRKEKND